MFAQYCDGYKELSKDFKDMIKDLGDVKVDVSNLKKDVHYLVEREKIKEQEYIDKTKYEKEMKQKKSAMMTKIYMTLSITIFSLIGWILTNLETIRLFLKKIWLWVLR